MRATPREGNIPIVFSHVLTTTPRSKAPHGRGLLAAESVEASLRPSKVPRSWLLTGSLLRRDPRRSSCEAARLVDRGFAGSPRIEEGDSKQQR